MKDKSKNAARNRREKENGKYKDQPLNIFNNILFVQFKCEYIDNIAI